MNGCVLPFLQWGSDSRLLHDCLLMKKWPPAISTASVLRDAVSSLGEKTKSRGALRTAARMKGKVICPSQDEEKVHRHGMSLGCLSGMLLCTSEECGGIFSPGIFLSRAIIAGTETTLAARRWSLSVERTGLPETGFNDRDLRLFSRPPD
jgi:hypothetical protein